MFSETEFKSGSDLSVGAEIELQIIDPATGQLAAGAMRILSACADAKLSGISQEFLLCMVEVKSDPCENVRQLRDDLQQRLLAVRNIARSLGYELAMGGTHPFARPAMAAVYPDPRYRRMFEQHGWMAYQEAVFGLHVHVGVPDGDAAIGVINGSVEYLPHLLALSANSPFWQGVDTEFASARIRMFHPSASAGMPGHFPDWDAYCAYCDTMQQAGLIGGTKDIYWDIRPQPKFGTVEFRICDVPSSLTAVCGLAALAHCLVARQLRSIRDEPALAAGVPAHFWLAKENKWFASRFGLETYVARRPGQPRRTIAQETVEWIDELADIAEGLGEFEFIAQMVPDRGLEIGATRQRRIVRQTGDWQAVAKDMCAHWSQELDASAGPSDPGDNGWRVIGASTANGTAAGRLRSSGKQ